MISILDYGAIPDGKTLCRAALQAAVDACHAAGGGTVLVPAGTYLVGTVVLRSHVHICLEAGATLLGSTDFRNDYLPHEPFSGTPYQDISHTYFDHSLFVAKNCTDIGVFGYGKIDMQGVWRKEQIELLGYKTYRTVKVFAFCSCSDIVFSDLTVLRATDLCMWLYDCERVRIRGLVMDVLVDGISPDACRDVVISDCRLTCDDDAIVLKSSYPLGRRIACENITISNCVVSSNFCAIKIGTETNGDFRNITVTGCVLRNVQSAGLTVQSTDGGHVTGVYFSNITMHNVSCPILVRLGARLRGPEGTAVGSISDVSFQNIYSYFPRNTYPAATIHLAGVRNIDGEITPYPYTSTVAGLPDHPVENITMRDVMIVSYGGETPETALPTPLPENDKAAPSPTLYGWCKPLPSHGLVMNHVKGAQLSGISFSTIHPDGRPATYFADTTDLSENFIGASVP